MSPANTGVPLAEVQEAAADTYEVYGELGRSSSGHPVYLAREKTPQGRMVLLDLRLVGQDPTGADEYALDVAGEVQTPGSVTGRICPSCGATDPRSGRYCARCRHSFADSAGRPVQSRQELLDQVRQQTAGTYDILGEIDHAAGLGVVYLAQDRSSGALVALRLQYDQAAEGREEYALDVTRSLDGLLASVVQPEGLGRMIEGRQPTIVRHTTTFAKSPSSAEVEPEAPPRRNWRRERAPRRTHARWWALGGLGALLLAGSVVFVIRQREAVVPAVAADSVVEFDTTVVRPPAPVDVAPDPVPTADTAPTVPPATVVLRMSGVPAGAVVKVDSVTADSLVVRLPPGSHTVAVTASGYRRLVKSVEITADSMLDLSSDLAAAKIRIDPCRYPGEQYNASDECYDQLPSRISGSAEVELPADFVGTPRPSILWVKVSPDGRTIEVQPSQRSSRQFEELAVRQAESMTWNPATKDGRPVAGWLQVEIRPARR
jgi:Gram-negative bacterial TonB protein C-terminal/PEGA domain